MYLIDATLSMLDEILPGKEQIICFLELAMEAGITHFQISPAVYDVMEGDLQVPVELYMEISSEKERGRYHAVHHFLIKKTVAEDTITVLQLNDLREIMQLRKFAGAQKVMLVGLDDFLCYEYHHAFREITATLNTSQIYLCPENSFDLAAATGYCFLKAGGKGVFTTFTGIGNRAATEQMLMSLRLFQHFKVNQNLSSLSKMKKLIETITGIPIPDKLPVLGERIFWVESGIHVDGIVKNPSNYELYPPELVGQKRTFVIGKHSGINSIRIKIQELGLEMLQEEHLQQVLYKVKVISMERNRGLTDKEFEELVRACE